MKHSIVTDSFYFEEKRKKETFISVILKLKWY